MAMAAARAGVKTLYVPAANAAEATLADGVTVYGVPDVVSLVQHLKGEKKLSPQPKWQAEQTSETGPDFSDVMGQENVKRARRSPLRADTISCSSARPARANPCWRGGFRRSCPT